MASLRVRVGCDFIYVAAVDTPVIFQVQPVESRLVAIGAQRWSSEPLIAIRGYTDLYGNPCVRAVLPAGRSSFSYRAVATCADASEDADEQAPECAHVHDHLTFQYGSTTARSTAADVNTADSGSAGTSLIWRSRSVGH